MAQPNKIRRRHAAGKLVVEQIQDFNAISALLRRAGMSADVFNNGGCFLMAYWGDDPVGIADLQTQVDIALMRRLFVLETIRRRGVGGCLLQAVRVAAHARGARMLYAMTPSPLIGYFARFGFTTVSFAEVAKVLGDVGMLQPTRSDQASECRLIRLDISRDGLIER